MPTIPLVAVWTLDKDGAITQALSKYFPPNIVESNSSSCKHRHNPVIQTYWIMWICKESNFEGWKCNRFPTHSYTLLTHTELCHTYVPSGHLYSGIPVNIRQQAEAEAFRVWWICESIHCQRGLRSVKRLPDALVQLIVRYRAPEGRLRVSHWLQVCRRGKTTHQLRKNHRAFLHWKKSKDQHWKVFSVCAQMCLLSYWQATTRPIQNHHLTNLLPLLWLPAKSPPYV